MNAASNIICPGHMSPVSERLYVVFVSHCVCSRQICFITISPEGKAFCPTHALMNAASNIICSIVFGDSFDYDDQRFTKRLELQNENIQQSGSLGLLVTASWFLVVTSVESSPQYT